MCEIIPIYNTIKNFMNEKLCLVLSNGEVEAFEAVIFGDTKATKRCLVKPKDNWLRNTNARFRPAQQVPKSEIQWSNATAEEPVNFVVEYPPSFDFEGLFKNTKRKERAPNAFILFRIKYLESLQRFGVNWPMPIVSRMASVSWKSQGEQVRATYEHLSSEASLTWAKWNPKPIRKQHLSPRKRNSTIDRSKLLRTQEYNFPYCTKQKISPKFHPDPMALSRIMNPIEQKLGKKILFLQYQALRQLHESLITHLNACFLKIFRYNVCLLNLQQAKTTRIRICQTFKIV
ncbi:hypothetical protein G9A89_002515 [Geosiphon pyriformis]|nr:hypothetical protein G9A89_002515 [Geosiphon pyriformis]